MPLRFSEMYRLTGPVAESVTLAEAKSQLRVMHSDDDDDITFLLQASREWAEDYTGLATTYQTWLAKFPAWPDCKNQYSLQLPRGPLSVVQSFRYINTDGDVVELSEQDDYFVDEIAGVITMAQAFWSRPLLFKSAINPIEIEFTSGFGDAAVDVPLRIRQAIRLGVASAYGNDRGNDRTKISFRATSVAEALLDSIRVRPT